MITTEFEILKHSLFTVTHPCKSPPSIAHNCQPIRRSTALRHIGAYDVHEQRESKHLPDALWMACRYSANVCKIVYRWMSPHIWHASFPNLSSVTVTSDPINYLPIILGHRGRINLVGSADDLPICDLGISTYPPRERYWLRRGLIPLWLW